MADIHLMLAGDISYAGGQLADGMVVVDGTTGAPVSAGAGGSFDNPALIYGVLGDGAGGFVIFGWQMTGFSGMARYLDNGTLDTGFAVTISAAFPPSGELPSGSQGVYQAIQHGTGWLVRGNFTVIGGVARNGFARLNGDGSVDTSWPAPNSGYPSQIALQGTKAIINADGTLYRVDGSGVDGTFNPTSFPQPLNSIYVQPDSKMVVTGAFLNIGGVTRVGIQKLRHDTAAPVLSVPDLNIADGAIRGVAQHAGGLLVFGTFTTSVSGALNRIMRLNSDNSIDTGFVAPVINGDVLAAIELQSGKILIGGTFTTVNGVTRQRVAVLNTDGTLDTGWVPPTVNNGVGFLHQTPDAKIYIIATTTSGFTTVGGIAMPVIARLNSDGTHDATYFGPVPMDAAGSAVSIYQGVLPQSDGKFVIWGSHDSVRGPPMKYVGLVDGNGPVSGYVDPNPNNAVLGVSLLSTGKFIVVGSFTIIGGISGTYSRIARLNADGSLDNTYPASSLGAAPDASGIGIRGIIPLSSNRRLVYTGSGSAPWLYRLNADGTIDGTYTPPTMNGGVIFAASQSDGKVILVGNFTTIDGDSRPYMCRLNADGTYDSSFPSVALSTPGTSPRLSVLSDDSIVLIHPNTNFTIGGQTRNRLAKISAAGVVDTVWNPAPNGVVYRVKQQSTGAVIVSGDFTSIGGLTRNRLARLNSDGTADATFAQTNYGTAILDFNIEADDQIVHGGSGTNGGTNVGRRWTKDGASDGTYSTSSFDNTVYRVQQLSDGGYLFALGNGKVRRFSSTGVEDTSWKGAASGGGVTDLIYVGGTTAMLMGGFTHGMPKPHGRLTRVNSDGTLDETYPGYVISPGSISLAFIDSSDEILVVRSDAARIRRSTAGVATTLSGYTAGSNVSMLPDKRIYQTRNVSPFSIMRLNADGTDDVAWGDAVASGVSQYWPHPGTNELVVWAATYATAVNIGGVTMSKVARLNSDGSIDGAWVGANYSASYTPEKVSDAGSGKLYITARQTGGTQLKAVFRLTATGTFDNWISGGTTPASMSYYTDVDPTDYSVVGWDSTTGTQRRVLKYTAAGALAAGWTTIAPGNLFWLNSTLDALGPIKVLPDSKVLVTGKFIANSTARLKRFNALVLDTAGVIVPGYSPGIVSQGIGVIDVRDGKHYLGAGIVANNTKTMPHVALRESSGEYSDDFLTEPYINPGATGASITATVNMVRMLPDGRAYIGGRFATLGGGITFGQGGYEIYSLARILPDGSPDKTFANARIKETDSPPPPQAFFPGIVRDLDIQADGRLLVVGEFTMVEGRFSRPRICRLTDTGDLDELFFITLNQPAWSVKERSDGKIWVGGRFTTVNGNAQSGIVLLNADGTVDTGFANPLINVGTNQVVHTLLPQSDGKLVVLGTFAQINAVNTKSIRRFNTDGTLDTGWDPAVSMGTLLCGAQDSTGRIYVGTIGGLFRLLASGAVDPAWTNPFSGSDEINSVVPLPGGGVIVGGEFVLAGRYSNVMLSNTGTVMPDLPALPLFFSDATPAYVSRVSFVPTPPMTMFPRMPPSRSYVGRPAEIQYRTYGGTKPYTHELIGKPPAGMTLTGQLLAGNPSEPGTHYWKVAAQDSVGQRIEHLTRLQVIPTALPWPLLGYTAANVTRVNANGTGQANVVTTNGTITNAIRLKNRKILLLGTFSTVGGSTRHKVALLNPDGTLDTGFTGPANATDIVGQSMSGIMLPDGKFLIGSQRTSPTPYFGTLYRLTSAGLIDGTFTLDSRIAMRSVQFLKWLSPGKVLVGGVPNSGTANRFDGACVFLIDENGALDTAYISNMYPAWGGTLPDDFFTSSSLQMYSLRGGTIPTGANSTTGIYEVLLDEVGDWYVCGSFIQTAGFGSTVTSETVAKAFKQGAHDTSYRCQIMGLVNPTNFPARAMGNAMFPQPDGTFVVVGSFNEHNMTVTGRGYAHIDRNGSPATPPSAWATTNVPADTRFAQALPDGRFLAHSLNPSAANARYFPDGMVDSSFSTPTTVVNRFMPDNAGIDNFSADGTMSFGIEADSEELDVFTADGSFYFFGGSPPGPIEEIGDGLLIAALRADLPKYGLQDGLKLAAPGVSHFDGLVRVMDSIELGDALAVILRELLAEGFEFGATASANYKAMMAVADGLLLAGVATSQLEAMNIVAVTFAFAELLRAREIEGLTEGLELGDALANAVRLGAQLVEELLLEAADGPSVVFGASVRDGFELGDAGTAILSAIELLQEGVNFTLHLNLDDGQYVAFVINTESKGTTQYQNYPFNSFARIGGRYFGMTPDGIRELEGPDDDGSPIAARFRLAMSRMGTGHLKRMVGAYLGYSSTGELRLKTITIQPDGVKRADHYRLLAQPGAPREARVKVGQGLRSVYWGFEVEAIDGAAFAIDIIDMQPIVVEQRIQGQNGGNR